MNGRSVDEVRYFKEMQRASEAGDPRATRALAMCFLTGHGTVQSVEKAAVLLRELDEEGDAKEMYKPSRLEPDPELGVSETIRRDFRLPANLPLPVSGGWGYGKEDAMVLSAPDGSNPAKFDFAGLELFIVEKRIQEECVIHEQEKLDGLKWRLEDRSIEEENGRTFARCVFKVFGYPAWVWAALRYDWESAGRQPSRNKTEAHEFLRNWFLKSYETVYWFDITATIKQQEEK